MNPGLDGATIPSIRREMRAARRAIRAQERALATRRATELVSTHFRSSGLHLQPGRIGTYMPSDGEMSPELIGEWFREFGWTTWVPVVGDDGTMTFSRFDEGTEMVANQFGIPEPLGPGEQLDARDLDLIVVPCVAIDRHGNRVGMGAGFYDRALAAPEAHDGTPTEDEPCTLGPLLIGIGFDRQLVENLKADPWDIPMDIIVTDEQLIVVGEVQPSG